MKDLKLTLKQEIYESVELDAMDEVNTFKHMMDSEPFELYGRTYGDWAMYNHIDPVGARELALNVHDSWLKENKDYYLNQVDNLVGDGDIEFYKEISEGIDELSWDQFQLELEVYNGY